MSFVLTKKIEKFYHGSMEKNNLFFSEVHYPMVDETTSFSISSQNLSGEKSCALFFAFSESCSQVEGLAMRSFVSFCNSDIFSHNKPFFPCVTISLCPPALITTGTHPAPIASTVEIPKCSARCGYFRRSSPYPAACQ